MTTDKRRGRAGWAAALSGRGWALLLLSCAMVSVGSSASASLVVKGSDIATGGVLSQDLRNNTVTGLDVKDGSLTRADFDLRSLRGPQGDRGPAGARGPAGFPGASGIRDVVRIAKTSNLPGPVGAVTATCPRGSDLLGGGGSTTLPSAVLSLSAPGETQDGAETWTVVFLDREGNDIGATAYALCEN